MLSGMPRLALSVVLVRCARLALAFVLLVVACNAPSPGKQGADRAAGEPAAPALPLPAEYQVTVAKHATPWLGTYVSSPHSFQTNSYWIVGPEGVVLIDTQFLPSAGVEAVELAEKLTGKKVVAALVLHPNPDKFNGTSELARRGIEVFTSAQVAERIPEVHALRHRWFYDRYKPDYPDQAPVPKVFGNATTTLHLAGIDLVAHVLGPGCSGAHVVIEYEKHVFVGDLVAGFGHSWLELGLVDEWQKRLDEIAALAPEHVHPGRGPSGGMDLLAREKAYLAQVIAFMQAENPRLDATPEDRKAAVDRVVAHMVEAFPGHGYQRFIEIGLPAVWDRLASQARN